MLTQTTIDVELGESGESTVLKQMKLLHQGGFSPDERIAYRVTIYQNLLESAQALVSAVHKLPIESVDAETRACHLLYPAAYVH